MKRFKQTIAIAIGTSLFGLISACGSSAGSSTSVALTPNIPQVGFKLIAGQAWSAEGLLDGNLDVAKFSHPSSIARDQLGNLYVASEYDGLVRKISSSGEVSLFAGKYQVYDGTTREVDGDAASARFIRIGTIISDAKGNLYVEGYATIRKISPDGTVSTIAGKQGEFGSTNGSTDIARINSASGMAFDKAGNLYFTDRTNGTIRMLSTSGLISTVAGVDGVNQTVDGNAATARLSGPTALKFDSSGNLFIAQFDLIRKMNTNGEVTTIAGNSSRTGSKDGQGELASFDVILDLQIDAVGNLYALEATSIRKISAAGAVSTVAGSGQRGNFDGVGKVARFGQLRKLTMDDNGTLYVADLLNHAIRKVTPDGSTSTLAGGLRVTPNYRNGIASLARFNNIKGITQDKAGNVFVADNGNCSIRKINKSGVVETFAGAPDHCGVSVNGTGVNASFRDFSELVIDANDNLYTSEGEWWSGKDSLRKIGADGQVSSFVGQIGVNTVQKNGIGSAANFVNIKGLTVDNKGNLLIADGHTTCAHREGTFGAPLVPSILRQVTTAGVVSAYAGDAGGSGGTPQFTCAGSMSMNSKGDLFVIVSAGYVQRAGADGKAGIYPIRFNFAGNWPYKISADEKGNVYIAEEGQSMQVMDANGKLRALAEIIKLPLDFQADKVIALQYVGNRTLLVATAQQVYQVTLP